MNQSDGFHQRREVTEEHGSFLSPARVQGSSDLAYGGHTERHAKVIYCQGFVGPSASLHVLKVLDEAPSGVLLDQPFVSAEVGRRPSDVGTVYPNPPNDHGGSRTSLIEELEYDSLLLMETVVHQV